MNGDEFVQTLPRVTLGDWHIEQRTIEAPEASLSHLRAIVGGGGGLGRYTPAGTYTGLFHKKSIVMSNTPDEIHDCREPVYQARNRGGHVLVNGLGLGWVAAEILSHQNVEKVTVVEIEEDVIGLVGSHLEKTFDGRVQIVHADALAYPDRLIPGTRFSVVWHDIWPTLCGDHVPEMVKLHRRYGRRCDWQGSWARHLCERLQ